jgi:hypothetical protein
MRLEIFRETFEPRRWVCGTEDGVIFSGEPFGKKTLHLNISVFINICVLINFLASLKARDISSFEGSYVSPHFDS